MKEETSELEPGVMSESQWFHTCGDKYVRSIAQASGGLPVILPSLAELYDFDEIAQSFDGFVFTGSPSNVFPEHYGHAPTPEHAPHDHWRDNTTLPLILKALEAGLPVFCICRGHQELNVALGGTLYPRVHELENRMDHRRPRKAKLDEQYGPVHEVEIVPGGALEAILGKTRTQVNSLHWQAIDRLAERLRVEARAPDGTIEAVSVKDAKGFNISVQWHPEYKALENEDSVKLFKAFGEAVADHAQRRLAARSAA